MSYFVNPDGTISFVEDRYDSAGNITGYKPLTHVEMTGDLMYDNRERRKERNIYGNLQTNIKKTRRPSVPPNPPKTDWMNFRGKTYTIQGVCDVVKLFRQFIKNNEDIAEEDVVEMERFLSKRKRKVALWEQFILYKRKIKQNACQET